MCTPCLSLAAAATHALLLKHTHREELSSQRLGLLPDRLSGVKNTHNGAHTLGTANGGQPGHTTTNDQHLGRGHLASSSDLASEEAAKVVSSFNDGPAAQQREDVCLSALQCWEREA